MTTAHPHTPFLGQCPHLRAFFSSCVLLCCCVAIGVTVFIFFFCILTHFSQFFFIVLSLWWFPYLFFTCLLLRLLPRCHVDYTKLNMLLQAVYMCAVVHNQKKVVRTPTSAEFCVVLLATRNTSKNLNLKSCMLWVLKGGMGVLLICLFILTTNVFIKFNLKQISFGSDRFNFKNSSTHPLKLQQI